MSSPRFTIEELRFGERDVQLRLPFRFGVATVRACPQAYLLARIRTESGREATGIAAEMMIPKWFDKNTALTHEQNFEQLREALRITREAYTAQSDPLDAFGHFAEHYADILAQGATRGLNPLLASYGPALVDRALLDALCHAQGVGFEAALRANLPGIDPARNGLAPDLAGFDIGAFLAARSSAPKIAARHTVGLVDAITDADAPADAPQDGLPVSLEGAIRRWGHTHFKLKLCGDTRADLDRLGRIAAVIGDRARLVTLDGNEQYADADAFAEFFGAWHADAASASLVRKTVFVEQPIRRDQALARDMQALARRTPLLIDESDATIDTFPRARALGYTGVSSKSCKGFYKSLLNAARVARWNSEGGTRHFLSGEDLTMQAGVGLQQDLALVACLGLSHVERNGHYYVNGMQALPAAEQAGFAADHPALYEHTDGAVRLAIHDGEIDLTSLAGPGFATLREGAGIDWHAMRAVY